MLNFLLKTPEDTKAFITFVKVVGNECFITANKKSIANFKTFVTKVIKLCVSEAKFQPLLTAIVADVIDSYRRELHSILKTPTYIQHYFITESSASKVMNPYIVHVFVK